MLNQYIHELRWESFCLPLNNSREIYISLVDFVDIFSPEVWMTDEHTISSEGWTVRFEERSSHAEVNDKEIELDHAPVCREDTFFIPIGEVMEKVFQQSITWMDRYLFITEGEHPILNFDGPLSQSFSKRVLHYRFNKRCGDVYKTIWMEEENRLNVYRMYIPFSYDDSTPYKLLVCLHGGNGNSDSMFIKSEQMIQYYAEKYGYLVLAPNSYVCGSNFGGAIPPENMGLTPKDPHAVSFYEPEIVEENQIAQRYVEKTLNSIFQNYNIDRKHVFVFGNSMGSIGVFHFLSTWPRLFCAGAAAGTLPMTQYLDCTRLKETPILFQIGTEDPGNPVKAQKECSGLKAKDVDIKFQVIGGGYHSSAWITALNDTFSFFESFD